MDLAAFFHRRVVTGRPGRRLRRISPKATRTTLLALSVLMLAATMYLGTLVVGQTRSLQSNVAYTQQVVDANVRTLGQVQRELLRLQVLLSATPISRPATALQEAFVDQRVQEGALPYQGQTLGSQELMDRSSALVARWTSVVRPALENAVGADDPGALATTREQITRLEKGYNQLVSDSEINRKVLAGKANDETRQLLSQAGALLVGLTVTVVSFLAFMAIAALTSRRSGRQREAAAAELKALNAELRTHALVVHATDNLVLITDLDGAIEWVNDAFVRTTGYPLQEAKGRRPGELLQGPDTDPATVEVMRSAVRDGRGFATEVLNYASSGREYWMHIEAHPVRDERGTLTRYIAIETDVTDRRRTEENLRRATETALSLAQEKAGFLATMSHEIRTPLNAVLGVSALLEGTDLDAEQQEYVRTAQRSGKLLLALVNDILDFSALDSGRIDVEARGFSVTDLINDIEAMFSTTVANNGLALTFSVADDVPAIVVGDENRIRQVLLNLVGNGLKFTHHGGVGVALSIAPDRGPDSGTDPHDGMSLRIVVADTGIGIAADRQERIFLPFTQVDASTTRNYGGTGLGLSICRLIAHHLGGSLALDSAPGEGSTFTFIVPVERTVAVPAAQRPPAAPSPEGVSSLRVLLAEDDATNRMVALRMLSRLGVAAEVAQDGEQAVDMVRANDFDVVLMDVHMPRLDGIAATAAIHDMCTDRPRPRIVAVTANALGGDRERLLAAGMDGYLSKPMTLGALEGVLVAVANGDLTLSPSAPEPLTARTATVIPDASRTSGDHGGTVERATVSR